MLRSGGLDKISEFVAENELNEEMKEAGLQALARVTAEATEGVKDLVAIEGGIKLLDTVIKANMIEDALLEDCIDAIADAEGGESVLLDIIVSQNAEVGSWTVEETDVNISVQREMVRVLNSAFEEDGEGFEVKSADQIVGLLTTLQKAKALATDTADETKSADAKTLQTETIELFDKLANDDSAANMIAENGGIDIMVAHMQDENTSEEDAIFCVRVLKKVTKAAGGFCAEGVTVPVSLMIVRCDSRSLVVFVISC